MTWIYENVTERLDLESRYNALIRVQGETLDHLTRGRRRVRLRRPAPPPQPVLRRDLGLDRAAPRRRPHVADIVAPAAGRGDDDAIWAGFTACVAGLDESRASVSRPHGAAGRARHRLRHRAAARRPDHGDLRRRHRLGAGRAGAGRAQRGARGRRRAEERLHPARLLRAALAAHQHHRLRPAPRRPERRPAQRQAARIHRLHHVVERRRCSPSSTTSSTSPPSTPASWSSTSPRSISPRRSRRRSRACRTALAEADIRIATEIADGIGSLVADGSRVRQILFNLLANAIAFSPKGGRVERLRRAATATMIEFAVADSGAGHPARLRRLGLRPLRQPRRAASPRRRRPRPLHRQELRRAARRHGRDPLRGGPGLTRHRPPADPAGDHGAGGRVADGLVSEPRIPLSCSDACGPSGAPHQVHHDRHHQQHEEHEEHNLRYSGARSAFRQSERAGDERD